MQTFRPNCFFFLAFIWIGQKEKLEMRETCCKGPQARIKPEASAIRTKHCIWNWHSTAPPALRPNRFITLFKTSSQNGQTRPHSASQSSLCRRYSSYYFHSHKHHVKHCKISLSAYNGVPGEVRTNDSLECLKRQPQNCHPSSHHNALTQAQSW